MLTEEQYKRVKQLQDRREAREMEPDFNSALEKLHSDHYDLDSETFNRWESYLIDHDVLALGAAVAMMEVRKRRFANGAYDVA